MAIRSGDGSEFQINGFQYYNWGETESATITVKGYRDNAEVASTEFEGWSNVDGSDLYNPIDVALGSTFDNVDEVRLYISAGGYMGDQSATNHSINSIIVDDPVIPLPIITSATYNASTGVLAVTGTNFPATDGAINDIVANKFTFTGEGGSTYTLTDTANVEITSGTNFTLTLSATDQASINQILNKNGTSSSGGTTYNIAAAEDWAAGADPALSIADTTGNGITASNVAIPAITSATYDASTGALSVTGTNFLSTSGATNDIVANKFTLTGEGGATYTLTDTANVEVTSGTSFTLSLSTTDKTGVNLTLNKNGTSSTGGTTYNLAAAEDWAAGADAAVVVADTTGNGITVSNVAVPAITSATYDASTGALAVTGTNFLSASGATNDIVANKFTLTGDGGNTYTLTDTGNVEITSGTSFTLTLSATDRPGVNALLNQNGTVSIDSTTYNLAAAEDWTAGADAAVAVADTTGNGITVSNALPLPTVTDANISISGASGTGGAFKIGDTVTATWNNTAAGDNSPSISGVTVNFSAFGGGAAVAATNSSNTWTATYTLVAGAIDAANRNVSVTATNDTGSTVMADTTNATMDNVAPTVTDDNISISGGTGDGGAYIVGDTVTATWNNTAGGDNNSDTISSTTVDFSQFGGGAAVAATNSSGTWTATYTIVSGVIDGTNRNISVTATDNAGNGTTTADTTNGTVDNVAPTVTDANISLSGASGTGGAYKVGDTVTATWNNTAGGDNNSDTISSTTVDFSAFGGGAAVAATNSSGTWTATYTITAGVVESTNLNVSVTATDNAGNSTTTADSTNATVDSGAPIVTDANISISGASGTGGVYKIGDTVTATWNNTAGGDNNSDTISSTTVDFSSFGGGAAVAATNSSGTWTATYTITAGAIDSANRNISVTATDNAGNATTTADTTNATVDNSAPTLTDANVSISGASGTGGAYVVGDTITATWNNTAGGDNNSDTISSATADFSAFGGGAAVAAANSSGTWTASYTIASDSTSGSNLNVAITAVDNAGNTTTTADTSNATVDSVVPTATIVVADTELNFGETSLVTITFNAVVTGFANADLTVENGSLSAVSSADGGITWTATFTPAADTDEPSNVITLDNTGVVDASGNAGTGTTNSNNFAIRTLPITLLVTTNLDTGDDATAAASLADDQTDGGGLSLREALIWVRSGDTITFDLDSGTAGSQGGTITLNGNLLTISYSNLNIDGDLDNDGTADVTISANNASRVMLINNSLSGIEIAGLTLTQGTITGGGAGLYIGSGSSVTVRDSNITNNAETGLGGGGVYGSGATLTMINSTVSGNSSSSFGGGIHIVGGGGTLNLINSTVSGNATTGTGAHGGGIQYGGSGALTIVNSTISGNTIAGASSLGGGLRITSGISYIYNATIVGNAATGGGGGVYANGTDTFVNVVIAGNTSGAGAMAGLSGSPLATGGVADDVGGTVETATNSYFGTAATITTNNDSFNNMGTATLLLGNLADNGGQVLTHRPELGSALIDAGSNAALPADTFDLDGDSDTAEMLPLDATGLDRVAGSAVDIGAKEANTPPVLTGFNGGGTYIENGAAVVIDNDASVSDAELRALNGGNGDYSGASLALVRNGGAVASDLFGFVDGNGISLVGSDLLKNDQAIASFDTSAAGRLAIVFTNANGETPTTADVNAVLRQITYGSSSQDPGTSASLDVTVVDEAGSSATATASLTIDPNDPPTLSGTAAGSATVGLLYSFTPDVDDPDAGDALSFSVTGLPAWLTLNAETGRISGTPADADVRTYSGIQLTVSDGDESASLPAFNIVVVPGEDTDEDTISDYQESLDGTDPADPTDYWDVTPPVLTAPEAVTLDAMALYTPVHLKQLLGLPLTASATEFDVALAGLATDNIDSDGCCDPTVDGLLFGSFVLLPPGRNEIAWVAEDRMGNTAEIIQVVNLRPLVSMSKDQTTVEGTTVSFDIVLNGESPVYPLTVPYVIDSVSTAGSGDHNLVDGTVTFVEVDGVGQTRASVSVGITSDGISEGDKTLVVRLDDRTTHLEDLDGYDPANPDIYDINAGIKTRHRIHIVEGNLSPNTSLQLTQDGSNTVLVTPAGGLVTATVQVNDPNPGDSASLDWSNSDNTLVDTDGDVQDGTLVFDPSGLSPGRYRVQVQVTDSEGATSTARLFFLVVADLPVLDSGTDTDSDTLDDQTEGTADTDDDGIPDYLDNIPLSNVLPEAVEETRSYLLECDPGVLCRLGRFALVGASGGAHLSEDDLDQQEDLILDPDFNPVGGIFDFEVRGLPEAGQSVRVALPLREPIPEGAVYRKFQNGEWRTFVEDDVNQLHSTAGNPGYCPPPGDAAWEAGLVPGHQCVQLTIQDGGPNDADGLANAAVEDPGAVSVPVEAPTEEIIVRGIKSTGGGGAMNILSLILLGGVMMFIRYTKGGVKKAVAASVKRGVLPLLLAAALWVPAQPLRAEIATDSVTVELGLYRSSSSGSAGDFVGDMAADGVTVGIERYDASRLAQQFAIGYHFRPWAGIQVGYLNLGDVDVDIQAQAADVDTLQTAFVRHYPAAGDGWTLSYRYQHPIADSLNVTADVGAFFWSRDIDVFSETIQSGDDNGVDPVMALGLNYEVANGFSIGGRVQRAYVDDDYAELWGVAFSWHF